MKLPAHSGHGVSLTRADCAMSAHYGPNPWFRVRKPKPRFHVRKPSNRDKLNGRTGPVVANRGYLPTHLGGKGRGGVGCGTDPLSRPQRCETDCHPSLIVELELLNESGERRVATVVPMDDRARAEVAEPALQVLLRQADQS